MDVKYFQGTYTLLISFSDGKIVETGDVNEDVLTEVDAEGKIFSVTIEHAGERIDSSELFFEQVRV